MRSPRGLKAVGPYVVTKAMASGVSACLATPFKIYGVNYSISSACATSAHCIGNAVEQIQLGKQDIVFAGGGEGCAGKWPVSSTRWAHCPPNITIRLKKRPVPMMRTVMGLSSRAVAVWLLSKSWSTLWRGAHIYAEIVGYGATSDGADMVAPSGEGAVRCMQMAMHGVDTPIDYLNSHGTSTPVGDVKELGAIREVFGDNSPAISATKAMTGHSLGAAGVQEAIYSLLMLEHGFIAPSINIEELDEQAAGLNIVTETTERELTTVMSNSFGLAAPTPRW